MKERVATASRIVRAPGAVVYGIIADYRTKHPLILPRPYFLSLEVEEGGFGAGTIVRFKMRLLGRTRAFRSLITEPVPGQSLLELDLATGISTRFDVVPLEDGERARVTISTGLKGQRGLEALIAQLLLQKIYRQELELLAGLAEQPSGPAELTAQDRAV